MLPQIQVWINNDKPENVEQFVRTLNDAMKAKSDKKLKAFFIFVDNRGKKIESELTALAEKTKANDVCLTYLAPDHEGVGLYKINVAPEVKNTVFLYRNRKVRFKEVNFEANKEGLDKLSRLIDELTN